MPLTADSNFDEVVDAVGLSENSFSPVWQPILTQALASLADLLFWRCIPFRAVFLDHEALEISALEILGNFQCTPGIKSGAPDSVSVIFSAARWTAQDWPT